MDFNNSFTLSKYSDDANNKFSSMHNRLTQIENRFQTRMNGRTMGKMVGTLVGNIVWCGIFVLLFFICREMIDEVFLYGFIAPLLLCFFMILDSIINISYYGRISSYRSSVSHLKDRVVSGKNNIKKNHQAFTASRNSGWNYALKAGASIPEEASSFESAMNNIDSLKGGFLNNAKNIMYYTTIIVVSALLCFALFSTNEAIINGLLDFFGADLSSDTIHIINIIVLIIVCIAEIICAKVIWSKTNSSVNNVTLLSLIIAPIAFLAVVVIVGLIIALVVAAFYILAIVAGIAIAWACTSGG